MDSQAVIDEVHKNDKLKKIIEDLKQGSENHSGFTYQRGILFYKDRIVVAPNSEWTVLS